MTLPQALRKALSLVREQKGVQLESSSARYRFVPSEAHRGYTLLRSIRYNDEWQSWIEVENFDVDDILHDKWRLV